MKHQTILKSALLAFTLAVGMVTPVRADNDNDIDPGDFTTKIDNPYFPLVPGTTFIYEGTNDRAPARDVFAVTYRTKLIMGVQCREILDRGYVDGVLEEETLDWFAQDDDGNVWYFGEDSKELDAVGNVISTEGSWLAGVDGALPGIVMQAHPRRGDTYRQELAPGVAEDMATVLALNRTVKVPYGTFTGCLETKDFSPLDPSVVEHKFYARGIGFVRSVMVKGGKETLELVAIRKK